jgi:hypothetical protein
VVEPGDTLWAIAQERLGAGATPGRIAEEVQRFYALNQERIGDTPNLLFPGQELWLPARATEAPAAPQPAAPEPAVTDPAVTDPAVTDPATTDPVAGPSAAEPSAVEPSAVEPSAVEPSAVEPTTADLQAVPVSTASGPAVVPEDQEPSALEPAPEPAPDAPEEPKAIADEQPVDEEPVDQGPAEGRSAAPSPDADKAAEPGTLTQAPPEPQDAAPAGALRELDGATARRLIGFGALALSLVVAILVVSRLDMRRPAEDPGARGTPPTSASNGSPSGANAAFTRKPYVDRTGMGVLARPSQREAPRRRAAPTKTTFSPNKRRPNGAHDPQVRLLLKGVPSNRARGGARAENRGNGGGR